jgi:hypothetical protein
MLEDISQPWLVTPEALRTGYERIKALKQELHRNITELLALAPCNDPFYAGSELDWAKGAWFKAMWIRLGFVQGVHLRRIHYRILDLDDRKKHDGMPYENTERDWGYLNECSKLARLLGLVPADAFIDRRNPAAHLPYWIQYDMESLLPPTCSLPSPEERSAWTLPAIESDLSWHLDHFSLPSPTVDGYLQSARADRRYYLEVWVEKSTQDDILEPLCRELGIGLVTSIGFQSMTRAIELLHRVKRIGKPTRILYISDFDPAGDGMPVAVARHLEYWLPVYAPGADIKLLPLALTRAQVDDHRLHRIPVKDTDRRKANFEERYGEGAVELDALEARVPGTLAALVRAAVAPYEDGTLPDRLDEANDDAETLVRREWQAVIAPYEDELSEIHTEALAILRQYETRLEELDDELQAQLAPLKERLQEIREDVDEAIEQFDPELPERPAPEIEPPDEAHWLFDSQRTYLSQMEVYKARQSGE